MKSRLWNYELVGRQDIAAYARRPVAGDNQPDFIDFIPAGGRFVTEAFIYASLPVDNGEGVARWHDWMRHQGFMVVSKRAKRLPDGHIKCDLDAEMMLDALEYVHAARPDVVVLVTGDGDYATLSRRLRRQGIRVEVASMHTALASELKAASNGLIDLADWAAQCEATGANAPELGTNGVFEERYN